MGCYNFVCSATKTPIRENDEVVIFIVEKDKECFIDSNSINGKRISMPFFGKYDDYGSVGDYYEEVYNIKGELLQKHNMVYEEHNKYKVMMHRKAYDALVNYNKLNMSELYDNKDIVQNELEKINSIFNPDKEFDALTFNYIKYRYIEIISSPFDDYTIKNNQSYKILNGLTKIFKRMCPEDTSYVLRSLLTDTKEDFINKTQLYADQIALFRNMDESNINFEPIPYGNQEEAYPLFIALNKASSDVLKKYDTKEYSPEL